MNNIRCPYCNKLLDKKPLRKKKCPHCKNFIYVRSGQLMTLQQVKEYESQQKEIWQKRHWVEQLSQYGITEKNFNDYQTKLSQEFGTKASVNDTVWRILNVKILQTDNYHELKTIYWHMAEVLRSEGKNPNHILEQVTRLSLLEFQKSGATSVTISTANDTYVCDSCKKLEGKVITIEQALKTMPIPHACTNHSGCRCEYLPIFSSKNARKEKKRRKKKFGLF